MLFQFWKHKHYVNPNLLEAGKFQVKVLNNRIRVDQNKSERCYQPFSSALCGRDSGRSGGTFLASVFLSEDQ